MTELLDAEPWDLVIVDEAHHARRKSPQQRKDTPNRLLQLLQQLKDKAKSFESRTTYWKDRSHWSNSFNR